MVRKANGFDIQRINELGSLLNNNFVRLFDMDIILTEEYSKVYVYELNNEIIAFLHITELYETVDIINIVVDPEYRGQNIATIMIDYMMSDVNETVKMFTLEVETTNISAINLYKKFGFEIVNTREDYYSNGDAYLMGKVVEA